MERVIAERISERYKRRFGEEFVIESVTPKKKRLYHFTYWARARGGFGKKFVVFIGNIILWFVLFIPRLIALPFRGLARLGRRK